MANGNDYTGNLAAIDERLAVLPKIGERLATIEANQLRDKEDRAEMKNVSKAVLVHLQTLPCKNHEGDVKVLETKVGNNSKLTWTNLALLLGLGGKLIYDWIVRTIP